MASESGPFNVGKLWNEAVVIGAEEKDFPDSPLGLVRLADWMRLDNGVASGGMLFAFETVDRRQIGRAVEAMHYFGRQDAAVFVENLLGRAGDEEYLDSASRDYWRIVKADGGIRAAFVRKLSATPGDFGLPDPGQGIG